MIELVKFSGGTSVLDIYSGAATSTPTASITEGATTTSLSVSTATEPVGVSERWTAVIPESFTDEEKVITVNWAWPQSATNRTRAIEYQVVAPYVHPVDAALRLGFSLDDQEVNYRSQEEVFVAERIARYTIDGYTNTSFGSRTDALEELGQGTDTLVLSDFIQSVSKIYENDVLVYDPDNDINQWGYPVIVTDTDAAVRIEADIDLYEFSGSSIKVPSRAPTFKDGYLYRVEGQYGFSSIPSVITECTLLLINDYLCAESTWRVRYLSDVRTKDWTIKFGPGATKATGNAIVDALLDDFRHHNMVVI